MVPIELHAKKMAARNWERICEGNCNQLLAAAHAESKLENLPWTETMRNVFASNGMLNIYLSTTEQPPATTNIHNEHRPQTLYGIVSTTTITSTITTTATTAERHTQADKTPSTLLYEKLSDQFHQTALANLKNSSKLKLYSHIKTNIGVEKYLFNLHNFKHRQALTKLRLSSHRLQIEIDRHTSGNNRIPQEDRICPLCHNGVEDEVHFLLKCPIYKNIRKHIHSQLLDSPSLSDFEQTVHLLLQPDLRMLAKFVYEAFTTRENAIVAQDTLVDIISQIEKTEKDTEEGIAEDVQNIVSDVILQVEKTEKCIDRKTAKDVRDTVKHLVRQVVETENCTQNNTTTNVSSAVEEKILIESTENRENKNSVLSKFHIAENSHDLKILFRKGSPQKYSITNISKDGLKIKIKINSPNVQESC